MTSRSTAAALGVGLVLALSACPPSTPEGDPPLRPLVYTESPAEAPELELPGYEMWTDHQDPTAYPDEPRILTDDSLSVSEPTYDLSTPDGLAHALFQALAMQDEQLLSSLIMTPREYSQAARAGAERAVEHIGDVRDQANQVFLAFRGEVLSEQRPGGLGALLEVEQVGVGSYRLVSGERADDPANATMVWGTDIRMRLRGSDLILRLRLPKLLLNQSGQWKLAEPPELGGRLQMFLNMGFHLSPTLLAFQHYPLPLQTGNYWTYQVRTVPRTSPDQLSQETHELDEALPRFTDQVISREEYDGYALVRLDREFGDPEQRTETLHFLLTPRRVFRCNRDCRRNIEDVGWLLSHLSATVTPDFVFPLGPGVGWRRGGRTDLDGDYVTWSQYEVATVPAGHFEATVRIMSSDRSGRTHRYFASGLGVVLTRIDRATHSDFYELVEYRIIP